MLYTPKIGSFFVVSERALREQARSDPSRASTDETAAGMRAAAMSVHNGRPYVVLQIVEIVQPPAAQVGAVTLTDGDEVQACPRS
jgi:hypothetical protein